MPGTAARRQRRAAQVNNRPMTRLKRTLDILERQVERSRAQVAKLSAQLARRASTSKTATSLQLAAGYVAAHPSLTPREREIVLAFLEHPHEKEIARRFGTRPQTIRNQLLSVQTKMGVSSRAELAVFLLTYGE